MLETSPGRHNKAASSISTLHQHIEQVYLIIRDAYIPADERMRLCDPPPFRLSSNKP